MLRPIGWAQLYYGVSGRSGGQDKLNTYAVFSFATLKLLQVCLERHEVEAYIKAKKLTKVILVRYSWENNEFSRTRKRLEYTPMKLPQRYKFTDIRKEHHWNVVEGVIAEEV